MRRRSYAVLILLAVTSSGLVAMPEGREALTNPLEFLLYGPEGSGFWCMAGEPRDLDGYWFETEDGLIDMHTHSDWAQTWRRQPARVLIEALRSHDP